MSIVDVGNEGYMMEHIVKLEARVQELEAQVISGFYEERAPIFRQGAPRHELESVVTAEEVSGYINRVQELEQSLWSRDKDVEAKDLMIRELEAENERLRGLAEDAYREGFYRAQAPGVDWDDRLNQWKASKARAALEGKG